MVSDTASYWDPTSATAHLINGQPDEEYLTQLEAKLAQLPPDGDLTTYSTLLDPVLPNSESNQLHIHVPKNFLTSTNAKILISLLQLKQPQVIHDALTNHDILTITRQNSNLFLLLHNAEAHRQLQGKNLYLLNMECQLEELNSYSDNFYCDLPISDPTMDLLHLTQRCLQEKLPILYLYPAYKDYLGAMVAPTV